MTARTLRTWGHGHDPPDTPPVLPADTCIYAELSTRTREWDQEQELPQALPGSPLP